MRHMRVLLAHTSCLFSLYTILTLSLPHSPPLSLSLSFLTTIKETQLKVSEKKDCNTHVPVHILTHTTTHIHTALRINQPLQPPLSSQLLHQLPAF